MSKLKLLFFPFALLIWYSGLFRSIDIQLAYFFNDWIRFNPLVQNGIAFLNSKTGDWLYDIIIASFIIPYIFFGDKTKRTKRFLTTLLLIAFTVGCYSYWNHHLCRVYLHIKCPSPSKVLPDLFQLSSVVHWIRIKQFASSSFPSGHGSTVCMFVIMIFHLMGRRVGLLATLISIPFTLPRMIVGAHWASDILLGSLPLALFNIEWFFYFVIRRFDGPTLFRKSS